MYPSYPDSKKLSDIHSKATKSDECIPGRDPDPRENELIGC